MQLQPTRHPANAFVIGLVCSLAMLACSPEPRGAQEARAPETQAGQTRDEPVVVYTAKRIITMDTAAPDATAVAVTDGRVSAVGSLAEVRQALGNSAYTVDGRFQDHVLTPGFIDNHLHPLLVGAFTMQTHFITPFAWNLPTGRVEGIQGREAYVARLTEIEAGMDDPDEILWTWGHHRLFHGEVWRDDLDRISSTRPIVVWSRSFHEVVLNSPALEELGGEDPKHPQVDWRKGWFMEAGFKEHFLFKAAPYLMDPARLMPTLAQGREVFHRGGITTAADMAAGGLSPDTEFDLVRAAYDNDETPFRVLYVPVGSDIIASRYGGLEEAADFYATLPERNSHRLRWVDKQVKLLADGAFYSQLMQMQDGYTDGHSGEWIMPPDELERAARAFWNKGFQIHVHTNGDLGMTVVLDTLEKLLEENPRDDHRFTIHHAGYFTEEQARRIGALGAAVSAQPYYLYAVGERYAEVGLGPERAHYIGRYKSLLDNGVRLSFHSDFTMAPAEPLRLGWVAVNRLSASGRVLGPEQRITVDQALRAVTIDAAYAIRMDDEIGSIEVGKIADFTVLAQDPYEVPAVELKNIPVWGTVFEGKPFPVEE